MTRFATFSERTCRRLSAFYYPEGFNFLYSDFNETILATTIIIPSSFRNIETCYGY
jgi:hypothetical protein